MSTATERIIIIDDEQRMRESLAALLSGDGYTVETFGNAKEAAKAIAQGKTDLVITDIRMPEMDGLELLKAVKLVDEDIPVILMTGFASLQTALEAIAQGAYDYLLKPVEFTSLELAVRRALEKRRSGLERLRLLEELKLSNFLQQRRIAELNALYEAGKSIGSTSNLRELLRQIVTLASAVTDAQVASIMLLDERGEYLTIAAAIGLSKDIIEKTRLAVGESIAGFVARTGEPLLVEDVEKHERFVRINQERYGAASLLCAPLVIKNKIIGVINMANKADGTSFTQNDLRLLTTFASQAAVAVDDANQFEKNRRRLTEFEILNELSTEVSSINSLNNFQKVLISKLKRVFPIDASIWFQIDATTSTAVPTGGDGEVELPLNDSGGVEVQKLSSTLTPIKLNLDDIEHEKISALSETVHQQVLASRTTQVAGKAHMAIPILRFGKPEFILYLSARADRSYSQDDISLARLVISQAALLFERERSLLNATRLLTMGNMISEISHDLRKPLTSIRGGLQILKQRHPEIASSEFLSSAEEEIHRMNELVRELVDFSNPNKYETQKLDLRQVVQRAVELVTPDLQRRKVTYTSSFDEAPWQLIINKNQILEVFLNIFINAIDAMPEGGSLTVRGLVEKPGHKKVEYLAVWVTDSGVGIKKSDLPRIFDRYYTTKSEGTGLGLAVVERVMSAHGGTLAVDSIEQAGTTFKLYFPYTT